MILWAQIIILFHSNNKKIQYYVIIKLVKYMTENTITYDEIQISKLDVSVRMKNALQANGINNYQQLLDCSEEYIQNIRNVGTKTIEEIYKVKSLGDAIVNVIIPDEEPNFSDIEIVSKLELEVNNDFIEKMYDNITFRDYNVSNRLKNCLISNKINNIKEFLLTPITEIQNYKSLGSKSLNEAINIKMKLLDLNNIENSKELLYLFIKKITEEEEKSVVYIKNYLLVNTNYNVKDLYLKDLNDLKNENRIEFSMNGISIKKPTLNDYILSLDNDKYRSILSDRINGMTLQEIADKEGLTRERVRQISTKVLNNIYDIKENMYSDIFEKYNFTSNEFCKLYNESEITFNYLKLVFDSGEIDLYDGIGTNDFTDYQKKIICKLRNKIEFLGYIIDNNKSEIVRILSLEYARDGITLEKFAEIYNKYANNYAELNIEYSDDRSLEGMLSRQDNIIFDFGRKFRYIDISNYSIDNIKRLHNLLELEDGYYSTLVLYNNNIDLMNELNINNQYELHNLYKKKSDEFSEIRLDRTPNFSVGNIDKHDFTLSKINELAPIQVGDFLDIMEKEYGHKSNTFLSYISTEFSEYLNGNFIDSDIVEINDELILKLKEILVEPIYSFDVLKDILINNDFENIDDIITKTNLYKVGYKIRSSYIIDKNYDGVEDYFIKLSKKQDFIKNDNILKTSTYSVSIKRVEKSYDIVSISDKEFITISKLNKLGIYKEQINKFCNDVYESFKNSNYFSVYNVKNMIDDSWIEDNGFDDIFYECLVETIDGINYLRINNQKLYSFTDNQIDVDDIINEFMVNDSISIDDLIDNVYEKYGLNVQSDKFIYNTKDKFYSKELNKLYLDKECYYKEVYNYE